MTAQGRKRGIGASDSMLLEQKDRKRLCIFCFYDTAGYVHDYIPALLSMLKPFLQDLIVVANGSLDERGQGIFRRFTNRIYMHENLGFDAGAYRYAFLHCLWEDELLRYDEVILCNDTFFFLRESFAPVFAVAQTSGWDVWGLTGCFEDVFRHIQSYFLAFGRKVIEQGLLQEYFLQEIDGRTDNIGVVCAQFETGLFDFLDRTCHMNCGALVDVNYADIYLDSYYCLRDHHVPVVKKKIFSAMHGDNANIMQTLSFIKYHTSYDVRMVLEFLSVKYGYCMNVEDILPSERYALPKKIGVSIRRSTDLEIENFLADSKFYIYGAGIVACRAYWRYARGRAGFCGFIVSDGVQGKPDTLFGYPVFFLHEVKLFRECRLFVAVRTEYANEIMQQFTSTEKDSILRLF